MKKEEVFREEIPRPYSSFINELEEKIRFLEQCLDNKEKVNKSMREEIGKLKNSIEYRKKKAESNQEKANQIDKIMKLPGVMRDGKIDRIKVAFSYII